MATLTDELFTLARRSEEIRILQCALDEMQFLQGQIVAILDTLRSKLMVGVVQDEAYYRFMIESVMVVCASLAVVVERVQERHHAAPLPHTQ